jgi:chitinase
VSKKALTATKMKAKDVVDAWNSLYLIGADLTHLGQTFVAGVKGYGSDDGFGNDWNHLETPNMRFHTVLGSHAYRYGLSYLPGDLNTIKSNLLRGLDPVAFHKFRKQLNIVARTKDLKEMEKAVTFSLLDSRRYAVCLLFLYLPSRTFD